MRPYWQFTCTRCYSSIEGKNLSLGLDLIAMGTLFTWAWFELFQGVNYFRRTLGFIVLVGFVGLRILDNSIV